jgi:hypothetical protein
MAGWGWIALGLVLAGLGAPAHALEVSFPDFADTTGLTLNGSATPTLTSDGTVLRLTPAAGSRSGSAFSTEAVNAADFSTFFRFRITDPGGTIFDCNTTAGADGIVFVAQSVSSSIGGAGQGIGYAGIGNSVGVELDTWCNAANNDPSSNHVGIVTGGVVNHGTGSPYTADVSPDFDDGSVWHVWIDYDGTVLEVRLSPSAQRPALALLSRTLDVPALLGDVDDAFVGFTSGTGADWGNHDILDWRYRTEFAPIPEPTLPALWVSAGVALAFARRRRSDPGA